MNRDTEAVRVITVQVDTIRLTPLCDGHPDHARAVTCTPHTPMLLLVAALRPAPPLALRPGERWSPACDILAALATAQDVPFPATDLAQAMDWRLHDHAAGGMAVETWTAEYTTGDVPPRHWLHHLLPRWTWTPADEWPLEEAGNLTVHTLGKVTPNPLLSAATPAPNTRPQDVDLPAVYYRQALTETPPPPTPDAAPALAD